MTDSFIPRGRLSESERKEISQSDAASINGSYVAKVALDLDQALLSALADVERLKAENEELSKISVAASHAEADIRIQLADKDKDLHKLKEWSADIIDGTVHKYNSMLSDKNTEILKLKADLNDTIKIACDLASCLAGIQTGGAVNNEWCNRVLAPSHKLWKPST